MLRRAKKTSYTVHGRESHFLVPRYLRTRVVPDEPPLEQSKVQTRTKESPRARRTRESRWRALRWMQQWTLIVKSSSCSRSKNSNTRSDNNDNINYGARKICLSEVVEVVAMSLVMLVGGKVVPFRRRY